MSITPTKLDTKWTWSTPAGSHFQIGTVGTQGPAGPAGSPGSALSYTHTQGSASALWIVNHNLGFIPNVEVRTPGGVVMDAEITHVSINQTTISFGTPSAGTARFV